MRKWLGSLIAGFLLCLAPGAPAREKGEPPPCSAANSQRLTIDALWSGERRLRGRCAAIEGYRIGDVIFSEQRAFYRYMAGGSPLPRDVVGIAWTGKDGRAAAGVRRGTYYGRVESCRETQRRYARTQRKLAKPRDDGEIILVHLYGFCASSSGPALRLDTVDEARVPDFARLTGAALRGELGELRAIDASFPHPAILPWLTGLATSACEEDFEATTPPPGGPAESVGAGYDGPRLGSAQKARLARWCASSRREQALFSVNAWKADGTKLDLLVCVCTAADCADRWPVALIDTGWGQARPYFCQRVQLRPGLTAYSDDGATEYSDYRYEFTDDWIVNGLWQDWGFAEPEATAG